MESGERLRLQPEIVGERSSPALLEVELRVPTDLDVWPGHFPGFPVVPAVLQVDWVMRAACRWLGPCALKGIPALKFRCPVRPGHRLTLRLRTGKRPGRLDFELADDREIVSMGRFDLEQMPR